MNHIPTIPAKVRYCLPLSVGFPPHWGYLGPTCDNVTSGGSSELRQIFGMDNCVLALVLHALTKDIPHTYITGRDPNSAIADIMDRNYDSACAVLCDYLDTPSCRGFDDGAFVSVEMSLCDGTMYRLCTVMLNSFIQAVSVIPTPWDSVELEVLSLVKPAINGRVYAYVSHWGTA